MRKMPAARVREPQRPTFAAHPSTGKHRAGHSWLLEAMSGLRSGQVFLRGSRFIMHPLFKPAHRLAVEPA